MNKMCVIMCLLFSFSFVSCQESVKTQLTIQEARENVINLIDDETSALEADKYIKDVYDQYTGDSVISNLYFYYMAKKQYENYEKSNNIYYLSSAKSYAKHIDSYYSGELSEQVHLFVSKLLDENDKNENELDSTVTDARQSVIEKWKNESGVLGTTRFIEDVYKQYPTDSTISNIYFYCIAKEQYSYYETLDDVKYLEYAKEYATNIDPNYSGEFSEEIQLFVDELLEDRDNSYSVQKETTDRYSSLTNSEKKAICNYIQSRYDYYDSLSGGYSGDKYTDVIWEEASEKYGLTESQLDVIWMNMYNY